MEVMFDRVAGLDVGKGSVTVCVRTPGHGGRAAGGDAEHSRRQLGRCG
jgi:hypothetical protein